MEFSTAAVAAAVVRDVVAVEEQCAALTEHQQFLRRAGISEWPDGTITARYSFVHALYQQLWHERVSVSRLQRWHLRIGKRLEAAYGNRVGEIATELAVHFEQGHDYARAVWYLRQAGGNASQRSAYQEAISHLSKALSLLQTLPSSSERTQQELMLQVALGPALLTTRGYAAPEVERTYTRARTLCDLLGETPQLFRVLRGLWVFYLVRAELQIAQRLGEQLLGLAQSVDDTALLLEAHRPLGTTLFHVGEMPSARMHLERGTALYDPGKHSSHTVLYGQDPGVISHIYAGLTSWFLGYPDQALERINESLTLAERLRHPFSLAWALFFAAVVHQLRRESHEVQKHAEAVIALSSKHEFPYWLAKGTVLRGWAVAEQGQGEEGIAQIHHGLAAHQATGSELWRSYYFTLLAEAYGKVRQREERLGAITDALAMMETTGERLYEAEIHRLRGEICQKKFQILGSEFHMKKQQSAIRLPPPSGGNPQSEAEVCFLKAIDIARKQQAKSLELRATMSLAHLWHQRGKTKQAHKVLSKVYGWFTEGFDTKDLQEAKALLRELS